MSFPLEPSGEEMRQWIEAAMDRIVPHVVSLPEQPAADLDGAEEIARTFVEPLPENGRPLEAILDRLFDGAVPKSLNAAGPGYLAYVPGGGIFAAAVADLVACATNRYVGVRLPAPALVQIEQTAIRWLADEVGLPREGGGILTSGGSLANLIALVTARRERLPENFLDGTIYLTDEVHHSVTKAAVLAGFPERNVRRVETDDGFRMRPDALARRVAEDRAAGLEPFLVVASGGTVGTGAVDPLARIAEVAERERLWLHVDAAYGGAFALTARGRRALDGIASADSVTLDPHKGLFLPYGTGCLLVRDQGALARAHTVAADYLPEMQVEPDKVDFCNLSPELSRDFRGLRLWLPLQLHGAAPFRAALDEKLDLARVAEAELRKLPGIEIVAPPELSLLAFRWCGEGLAEGDELDEINRALLERVNARRRVHLTGTMARGRFVLRICVLSFRTHADRMTAALEDLEAAIAETEAEVAARQGGLST